MRIPNWKNEETAFAIPEKIAKARCRILLSPTARYDLFFAFFGEYCAAFSAAKWAGENCIGVGGQT
jgi:hypothetical protein